MFADSYFQHRAEERAVNKVVCMHLVRRPDLLASVGRLSIQSGFFDYDYDLLLLVLVALKCKKDLKQVPGIEIFLMETSDYWEDLADKGLSDPYPRELIDSFKQSINHWWSPHTTWSDEFVKQILEPHIKGWASNMLSKGLSGNDDIDLIKGQMSKYQDILNGDIFQKKLGFTNVWSDIWGNLQEEDQMEVGQTYFDQALDGGLRVGEAMLVVMPSGGGKTTLGFQFASHQVDTGQHVVYFSTEQDAAGDLTFRQLVLGTHERRDVFKGGPASVPASVHSKIAAAKIRWEKYFHLVEAREAVTVEQLWDPLDALIEEEGIPSYVVLDWWGRLKNRLIFNGSTSGGKSDFLIRAKSSNELDKLIQGIKARRTRLIVLHQLAGAAATKGPKAKVSSHDAQEDSNLNNLFEFAFASSQRDSDERCRMNGDKARTTARTDGFLQLDGPLCRFSTVDPTELDMDGGSTSVSLIDAIPQGLGRHQ